METVHRPFILLFALSSLLLGGCQNGIDYSDLFVDSSLSGFDETISDTQGNAITVRDVYLLDDDYFVLDADITFRAYILFSYQIIPISGSNLDLSKTIEVNGKDLYYGLNSLQDTLAFYFTGATSFDNDTIYSINFNIVEEGYEKSYFQFVGSQVGHKSSE